MKAYYILKWNDSIAHFLSIINDIPTWTCIIEISDNFKTIKKVEKTIEKLRLKDVEIASYDNKKDILRTVLKK